MPVKYLEIFDGMTAGNPPTNPPWSDNSPGDVLITNAVSRIGSQSLKITRNATATQSILTQDVEIGDRIGFLIKTPTNAGNGVAINPTRIATGILYAGIVPDGGTQKMAWYPSGGPWTFGSALATNTWYWIEIRITSATTYDIYLDGVLEFLGCTCQTTITDKIDALMWLTLYNVGGPWTTYLDYIYIQKPEPVCKLGAMRLGSTMLGSAKARINFEDTVTLSEETVANGSIPIEDTVTPTELLSVLTTSLGFDTVSFSEYYGKLPAEGYMGILGKIVLRMDVDSTDFCRLVWETGQSIEINGTPSRAYLQVQQSKRNYDHGVSIYPGDAVMYSCPEDSPVLMLGDIIMHDSIYYRVIAIQHSFFNGNLIYRESGLMKIRSVPAIGRVSGLTASENLDGKTTLTWDDMDVDSLSHYEVWESTSTITTDDITEIMLELDYTRLKLATPYVIDKYITNHLATITDSANNDGDYPVQSYQNDGYGNGEIRIAGLMNTTAPLGTVYNMKNHYPREKTKSNSISIKNLIPNLTYFYLVRAVDVYGIKGKWSLETYTPTKSPGTRKVEGLR
jgi:hypothetical protein